VSDGHRVIAAGRRTERLLSLQSELGGPDKCYVLTLDVRDRAATEAMVASLPAEWRDVDVCVNVRQPPQHADVPRRAGRLTRTAAASQNAGLALGMEMAQSASLDDWDTMVDTNVRGLLYVTRACLPGMVARNRGHIINLGSTAAEFPYPGGNVYGATKAFVYQFTLNLRADLLGSLVRVTDIEPGMCSGTEFSNVRFKGDDDKAAAVYANTLTAALSADDIADAVAYVASRPPHVNINSMQLMPVCQAFGPMPVKRTV